MSSACQFSVGCLDAHVPVHPAYANLYKWAESDAKFVRSLSAGGGAAIGNDRRRLGRNPAVVDSYSCRQKFLRSYTFSKKETVPEKTVKCLGKVKERATELPCIHHRRNDSGESLSPCTMLWREEGYKTKSPKKKKRRSVVWCIFRRLLSCMSSFDVVDGNAVVHAL